MKEHTRETMNALIDQIKQRIADAVNPPIILVKPTPANYPKRKSSK